MECNEILSWPEEDGCFQTDSGNEIARCLWDELNQGEDSLLYMLGEQTPAKESMDLTCSVLDTGEKSYEGSRESSIVKRRRMLQFDPSDSETTKYNNIAPSIPSSQVQEECTLLSSELSESLKLASGCTGGGHSLGDESLVEQPLGDWWSQGCLNEPDMQYNCDELISFGTSDDLIDVSEFCKLSPAVETPKAPQVTTPSPQIKFKGRKSPIKAPTSPASVAYPFELFKPSVIQGDVTLSDINRRIHLPPPSKLPCIKQKEPAFRYPTSAISGKPVVAKTKIRTDGGRGSITITRTKG